MSTKLIESYENSYDGVKFYTWVQNFLLVRNRLLGDKKRGLKVQTLTWIGIVGAGPRDVVGISGSRHAVLHVAVVAVVRVREEGAAGVVEARRLAVGHRHDAGQGGAQVVAGVVDVVVESADV
jgi:hypothetical protein